MKKQNQTQITMPLSVNLQLKQQSGVLIQQACQNRSLRYIWLLLKQSQGRPASTSQYTSICDYVNEPLVSEHAQCKIQKAKILSTCLNTIHNEEVNSLEERENRSLTFIMQAKKTVMCARLHYHLLFKLLHNEQVKSDSSKA